MNNLQSSRLRALIVVSLFFALFITQVYASAPPRYRIAVVDLMILKRQKLSAFDLAKELGADGLEVDMGGLGNRLTFSSQLSNRYIQQVFLNKSRETGVQISSLAMTGFFGQSFAERETYQKMVGDCITTMREMAIKTAFLPLGINADLLKRPELRPVIVERLKVIGEMARKAGVVIGIETTLAAKDDLQLLKDVNSKGISIYFKFANAIKYGRNISEELKTLGKKNICMIHCTNEDGVWLQNDKQVDLPSIKQTLDKMGWKGWLVVERSRDQTRPTDVKYNFSANVAYLKKIFQNR